ncbi:MAG: hypothetical protein JWO56_1990 [Acidobacteria bacterium]|nr:hypothetical protein [Acidobacteriota bacterium]
MRAIFAFVASAFRTVLGVGAAVIRAPFRILFGAGGGTILQVPEVAPETTVPEAPATDYATMYAELAVALQTWAAQSLLADEMQPLPPKLPRNMREWAQGLGREEMFALVEAEERTVSAHILGLFRMPRVRAVGPLPSTEWRPRPRSIDAGVEDLEFDVTVAAGVRL